MRESNAHLVRFLSASIWAFHQQIILLAEEDHRQPLRHLMTIHLKMLEKGLHLHLLVLPCHLHHLGPWVCRVEEHYDH